MVVEEVEVEAEKEEARKGRGTDSRNRMGRWKASVSAKQRKRKKRYCRMMGWVVRKFEKGVVELFVGSARRAEEPEAVSLEVRFVDALERSGKGAEFVVEEAPVAFSIRAQVR